MIRSGALRNPEQGMALEETFDDQPALADRLATARSLSPRPTDGCRDCWCHGRDAALAAVMGDEDGLGERIAAARRLLPQGSELHWRASWERGRDAALQVIDGE